MVVLRQGDLFELSAGKFIFQAENDLHVCRHLIIFDRIFSIDLSHHQQRIAVDFKSGYSKHRCHLEASDGSLYSALLLVAEKPRV